MRNIVDQIFQRAQQKTGFNLKIQKISLFEAYDEVLCQKGLTPHKETEILQKISHLFEEYESKQNCSVLHSPLNCLKSSAVQSATNLKQTTMLMNSDSNIQQSMFQLPSTKMNTVKSPTTVLSPLGLRGCYGFNSDTIQDASEQAPPTYNNHKQSQSQLFTNTYEYNCENTNPYNQSQQISYIETDQNSEPVVFLDKKVSISQHSCTTANYYSILKAFRSLQKFCHQQKHKRSIKNCLLNGLTKAITFWEINLQKKVILALIRVKTQRTIIKFNQKLQHQRNEMKVQSKVLRAIRAFTQQQKLNKVFQLEALSHYKRRQVFTVFRIWKIVARAHIKQLKTFQKKFTQLYNPSRCLQFLAAARRSNCWDMMDIYAFFIQKKLVRDQANFRQVIQFSLKKYIQKLLAVWRQHVSKKTQLKQQLKFRILQNSFNCLRKNQKIQESSRLYCHKFLQQKKAKIFNIIRQNANFRGKLNSNGNKLALKYRERLLIKIFKLWQGLYQFYSQTIIKTDIQLSLKCYNFKKQKAWNALVNYSKNQNIKTEQIKKAHLHHQQNAQRKILTFWSSYTQKIKLCNKLKNRFCQQQNKKLKLKWLKLLKKAYRDQLLCLNHVRCVLLRKVMKGLKQMVSFRALILQVDQIARGHCDISLQKRSFIAWSEIINRKRSNQQLISWQILKQIFTRKAQVFSELKRLVIKRHSKQAKILQVSQKVNQFKVKTILCRLNEYCKKKHEQKTVCQRFQATLQVRKLKKGFEFFKTQQLNRKYEKNVTTKLKQSQNLKLVKMLFKNWQRLFNRFSSISQQIKNKIQLKILKSLTEHWFNKAVGSQKQKRICLFIQQKYDKTKLRLIFKEFKQVIQSKQKLKKLKKLARYYFIKTILRKNLNQLKIFCLNQRAFKFYTHVRQMRCLVKLALHTYKKRNLRKFQLTILIRKLSQALKAWSQIASYNQTKKKAFNYLMSRRQISIMTRTFDAIRNYKQVEQQKIKNYYLQSKFNLWQAVIERTADLRRKYEYCVQRNQLLGQSVALGLWREVYYIKVANDRVAVPFSNTVLMGKALKKLQFYTKLQKNARVFNERRLLKYGFSIMLERSISSRIIINVVNKQKRRLAYTALKALKIYQRKKLILKQLLSTSLQSRQVKLQRSYFSILLQIATRNLKLIRNFESKNRLKRKGAVFESLVREINLIKQKRQMNDSIRRYHENAVRLKTFKLLQLATQFQINKRLLAQKALHFRQRLLLSRWYGKYLISEQTRLNLADQHHLRQVEGRVLLGLMIHVRNAALKKKATFFNCVRLQVKVLKGFARNSLSQACLQVLTDTSIQSKNELQQSQWQMSQMSNQDFQPINQDHIKIEPDIDMTSQKDSSYVLSPTDINNTQISLQKQNRIEQQDDSVVESKPIGVYLHPMLVPTEFQLEELENRPKIMTLTNFCKEVLEENLIRNYNSPSSKRSKSNQSPRPQSPISTIISSMIAPYQPTRVNQRGSKSAARTETKTNFNLRML